MIEDKCVICEANFRPDALITSVGGLKKCGPCEKAYPQAFSKKEVQVKTENKAQALDEARVRELVYDILEEANIKRHKCKKCGAMFFRHKPMQEVCHECDSKEKGDK